MLTRFTCLLSLSLATLASAAPIKVEITGTPGSYTLLRDGQPYFIKGAGGGGPQKLLADIGGNSGRTWGAENLKDRLDEAHKLGLTLTVGIWLKHPRHGAKYNDPAEIAAMIEAARAAVNEYKDHPALLMWGIGNEMEGEGNDAAIWSAVNTVASVVKRADPNHPTMTVIAEMGEHGQKIKNIHALCPDIDVIGINAYGGSGSVAERYKKFGGTKPYVVTEFGPAGAWEVGKNDFQATQEQTSTQKATQYKRGYEGAVVAGKGYCFGSYAFTWGHKFEATATWFGLLLPDHTRLAGADTLSEFWTGKPPANRVPVINTFKVKGADRGAPGSTVNLELDVADPENDPLKVEWAVLRETDRYITGGDPMASPESIPGAVKNGSLKGCTVELPREPGIYRVYVYIRDTHGGGATASAPLRSGAAPAK